MEATEGSGRETSAPSASAAAAAPAPSAAEAQKQSLKQFYSNVGQMTTEQDSEALEAETRAQEAQQIADMKRQPKLQAQDKKKPKRSQTPPPSMEQSGRETTAPQPSAQLTEQRAAWIQVDHLVATKHNLPQQEWKTWLPKLMAIPQITPQQLLESIKLPLITLDKLRKLEKSLLKFLESEWDGPRTQLIWRSEGQGAMMPSTPVAHWPGICLQEMARLDFYRGKPEDDPGNKPLAVMFHLMHELQYHVRQGQKYNLVSSGNVMEIFLGASYAMTCGNRNIFPAGGYLTVQPPEKKDNLVDIWYQFQDMGFGPAVPQPLPDCVVSAELLDGVTLQEATAVGKPPPTALRLIPGPGGQEAQPGEEQVLLPPWLLSKEQLQQLHEEPQLAPEPDDAMGAEAVGKPPPRLRPRPKVTLTPGPRAWLDQPLEEQQQAEEPVPEVVLVSREEVEQASMMAQFPQTFSEVETHIILCHQNMTSARGTTTKCPKEALLGFCLALSPVFIVRQ